MTVRRPHRRAGFAGGLAWLGCAAAHAATVELDAVDGLGKLLRAVESVPSGWWQSDFLTMGTIFCSALACLYQLMGYWTAQEPVVTKEPAGRLVQVQQEVARLEALLGVRAKALQAALLAVYEADRDRADLLGSISSNLRAPVEKILGDARTLVSEVAGDAGHENIILRSAIRLQGLVDDLIACSQAGVDTRALQLCPTDLRAWLQGLAAEAQGMEKLNGNHLNCTSAGELPSVVHLDQKRLRLVLLELLNNAATGLQNGQIDFETTVQPCLSPAASVALTFTVCGKGKGIAASRPEQIFAPFARCTPDPADPGVGLAIARHRARLMNGELVAASESGQGMVMTLVIPVDVVVDQPGQPSVLPGQAAAKGSQRQNFAAPMVLPEAAVRAHLAGLIKMGAISDLIDWASSADAGNAAWHGFARAVADRADCGDLDGISALLAGSYPAE